MMRVVTGDMPVPTGDVFSQSLRFDPSLLRDSTL